MNKEAKQNKRTRDRSPIIILAIGFIIGCGFIGLSIYKSATSNYSNLNVRSEVDVKKDVDSKLDEIKNLRNEREEEYKASAYSNKYKELSTKITTAEGELSDLEAELYNVKNGIFNDAKKKSISSSVPFTIVGCLAILGGLAGYTLRKNKTSSKKAKIISMDEEK